MTTDTLLQRAAAKVREREGKPQQATGGIIAKARHKLEATPEERLQRLAICETCEHAIVSRIAGKDVARCGACGCPLATRTRMKYIPGYGRVTCPKGKW